LDIIDDQSTGNIIWLFGDGLHLDMEALEEPRYLIYSKAIKVAISFEPLMLTSAQAAAR